MGANPRIKQKDDSKIRPHRGGSRPWPEIRLKAAELDDQGIPRKEIAEMLEVSYSSIIDWLGPKKDTKKHSEGEKQEVIKLRWEGKSLGQISYLTGIPRSTIWTWLNGNE